jgi:hypothetical protein
MNARTFFQIVESVLGEDRKVRVSLKNGQVFVGHLFDMPRANAQRYYGITYREHRDIAAALETTSNAYFEAEDVATVGWDV